MKITRQLARYPTLGITGYMGFPTANLGGAADDLTGWRRYREIYGRARNRWGVRVTLRHVWTAYRRGVVLSGDPYYAPLPASHNARPDRD